MLHDRKVKIKKQMSWEQKELLRWNKKHFYHNLREFNFQKLSQTWECAFKENIPTVEKKRLLLVLPYLGIISFQTRTKLQEALKGVLNCCKLEIVFKCQTRLSNFFRYKDPIPKDLVSGVVYIFQCGLCNESYESVRHLDIRSGEQEVCHLLLEIRSNHEIIVLFVIIYSTVNFYPLLTTLVF